MLCNINFESVWDDINVLITAFTSNTHHNIKHRIIKKIGNLIKHNSRRMQEENLCWIFAEIHLHEQLSADLRNFENECGFIWFLKLAYFTLHENILRNHRGMLLSIHGVQFETAKQSDVLLKHWAIQKYWTQIRDNSDQFFFNAETWEFKCLV